MLCPVQLAGKMEGEVGGGKHHAGGRFVPNVFMKDSLIKGGKERLLIPNELFVAFFPKFPI